MVMLGYSLLFLIGPFLLIYRIKLKEYNTRSQKEASIKGLKKQPSTQSNLMPLR